MVGCLGKARVPQCSEGYLAVCHRSVTRSFQPAQSARVHDWSRGGLRLLISPSVALRIQQCLRENLIHFPQAGAARAPGQHHERDQPASRPSAGHPIGAAGTELVSPTHSTNPPSSPCPSRVAGARTGARHRGPKRLESQPGSRGNPQLEQGQRSSSVRVSPSYFLWERRVHPRKRSSHSQEQKSC